jgi:branched-chain amino acid transport system ATP-binding protein
MNVTELSAGYGDISVLHDVTIEVRPAEVVTLLGVNGAGKSTLLRAVSGLIPSSGSVQLDGGELNGLPAHERVAKGLIHVPEGRQLFGELTVEENVWLGGYSRTARKARPERLEMVYDLFPVLAERRRQRAETLSGGEQQMLAISRGLLGGPKSLLLDEPSLGVAPVIVDHLMEALRTIADGGVGVLLVEQNAVQALHITDRVYVLDQGRITTTGPAAEYVDPARLAQAYLGDSSADTTTLLTKETTS